VTPEEAAAVTEAMHLRVASFIEAMRDRGLKVTVRDDGSILVEMPDEGDDDHAVDLP